MENEEKKLKLYGLIDIILYIIELIKNFRRKKDEKTPNVEKKL